MAQGKIKTLFSDREKTEILFPRTKTSAISNEDGVGLDALIQNVAYVGEIVPEDTSVPVNADTLGGRLPSDFATANYVHEAIAKAQLEGASGIDLSAYATKEDLRNLRAIDVEALSVDGGHVNDYLSVEKLMLTPETYGTELPEDVTAGRIFFLKVNN